ncbi:MAG TPA: glycosyltransferase [Steroidobacteraceae bacterium]|nr:glycosyltransferase [Steroidobacteraceae bacterium]
MRPSDGSVPEVSFVVPAFNEEAVLAPTLAAIAGAAAALAQHCEVIVVDDASTDGTRAIARSAAARVVSVQHRQIAATRNAGARAARGRYLIFVDADTLVTPEVVRAAIAALRSGAVGGGCGLRFEGRLPRYARILIALALPLYQALRLAAGCFVFCTREAFDEVGGFDESLFAAEEVFLSRALRRRGRFVILRETVTTSGRKLRSHSGREVLRGLWQAGSGGRRTMGRRQGLEIWYGARRKDPG